jgi:hypothetical protein
MSMAAILASRPTTEHKLGIGGGFKSLKKHYFGSYWRKEKECIIFTHTYTFKI